MNGNAGTLWADAPDRPTLRAEDVHIWRSTPDVDDGILQSLGRDLSEDERGRAEKFHFEKDRRRYIVGRGALRNILSRYLRTDARQLTFQYGPRGKPLLAGSFEREPLRFNLAHSGGLVLYGFALGRDIGVDVERTDRGVDFMNIAERFFSAREFEALNRLHAAERRHAFFHCWARKEAYLKATGGGLSDRLDGFSVTMDPRSEHVELARHDPGDHGVSWTLRSIDAGPGYAAAVSVEGVGAALSCWNWPDVKTAGSGSAASG